MRVIFIKDLKKQGKKGEIKEVKAGYATNFLIKNGYAVPVTEGSLGRLQTENQEKAAQEKAEIAKYKKMKQNLENQKLVFKVKTGNQDKVFGSISSKQVSAELEKKGYEIDKKKIIIDNPIASLGVHYVNLNLHPKVTAKLAVELIKD